MAKVSKRRGRYVLDYYHEGRRVWKTLPAGTLKADAEKMLREIMAAIDDGSYVLPKKTPIFSEVSSSWLAQKKTKVRFNTYKGYRIHVNTHLDPFMGHKKISAIKLKTVEDFITYESDRGIGIATIKKVLVNLGAILDYAIRHGYISRNPARDVEQPKAEIKHREKKRITSLNYDQGAAFLSAVKGEKYYTLFMAALMTGARQGELLGLKWGDVLWESSQVEIQRTYNTGRFFPPKTESSARKIDLAPQLVTQLKKWQLQCPPGDLIIPNDAGNPMSAPNMIYRYFRPALKKAGLPQIRFHDLRHTYASMQIDLGANIKYLQAQMGHSSIQVTLDIYGHLLKTENREAATKLGNAILESGSNMVAKRKAATGKNL